MLLIKVDTFYSGLYTSFYNPVSMAATRTGSARTLTMMRSLTTAISATLFLTAHAGFAEAIISPADHAVDSDVVLESAVDEVKAVPRDAIYIIDDAGNFIKKEARDMAAGVKSAFRSNQSPYEKVQKEGEAKIKNAWDTSGDLQFRSYKLSKRLGDLLQAYVEDKTAASVNVVQFFQTIDFPEGAVARYLPEFQSLLVHQTEANLLEIETVLASYQRVQRDLMGRQVEIEIKFIEVSQNTLNELGFEWTFGSKDGGDLRLFDNFYFPAGQDILSDGLRSTAAALGGGSAAGTLGIAKTAGSLRWAMMISALEQTGDSDVLSAPRVVTHSHETAVIQVGEEWMIPKAFEIQNQNTSPFVQHSEWELQLMGVQMEVTPEIRRDGLIDLKLTSKILNYIGDDRYQITPAYEARVGFANGSDDDVSAVDATLPYFRIRSLDTRVTVADGNTIAMGGLIYDKLETFRDKVPVLGSIPWVGRLFRSEGERSVKRNLMIFVTATQVDVNGRRTADLALQKSDTLNPGGE